MTPVVLPLGDARASRSGATPGELEQLLEDLAPKMENELQLPDATVSKSKMLQVLWQESGGAVAWVEVLYARPLDNSTGYWIAGQRRRETEDATWKGEKRTVAAGSRFWKQRGLKVSKPGPEGVSESYQQQLYRFHDGVESWISGDLSDADALAVADSFHDIGRRGVNPLLVLGLGFVLIFIWPAYGAWAAHRRYQAKLEKHNRSDQD